jgi:hypothetical protein
LQDIAGHRWNGFEALSAPAVVFKGIARGLGLFSYKETVRPVAVDLRTKALTFRDAWDKVMRFLDVIFFSSGGGVSRQLKR